jgi:Zn finger protein HypA/HybF involved in hydrogenase expression
MFFVPICIFGVKKDTIVQINVEKMTSGFVELTTAQGYLTKNSYEKYLKDLSDTGKFYEVALIHEQNAFEPEYKLRSALEVIEEDETLWEGINEYIGLPVTTKIPVITDPIDNSGLTMNTETNESVLAKAIGTPALPGHVHTEACYAGHKHQGGSNTTFTHSHAHTYSSTPTCTRYLSQARMDVTCRSCGQFYTWLCAVYWMDPETKQTSNVYLNLNGVHNCVYCNSTNLSVAAKNDYAYTCGYNIDLNGDTYNEEIAYGVTQTYSGFSAPQSRTKATYTNGCYSYHVSNDYTSYYKYYEYSGVIKNAAEVYNILSQAQFQGFCTIPLYYTIKYYSDEDDPNSCRRSITYMAQYAANGTVSLVFSSYYDNGWPPPNLKFPQTLTPAGLSNLNSKWSFNDAWYIATGQRYTNGTWATTRVEYYGELDTCDFNHSLANRWVATCGLVEDATLVCNQKVVSMLPTHPTQAVYVGEKLITTATATYMDGSTNVVICTTAYNANTPATGVAVPISYTDATGKTVTGIITLTVIPKIKTCINGHIYNLNVDGSDPGCPYCYNLLRSLSVAVPSSGRMTMYRNVAGSLEAEGVGLRAVYLDGHVVYVYHGYVNNLDPDYVGIQTVTIGYKGLTTTLQVEIVRNKKKCEVCGLYYNLYIDDTDPGCPYCKAKVPVFTGNVMDYCRATYEDEIITELYEGSGTYYFRHGDSFIVKTQSRNKLAELSQIGSLFKLQIRVQKSDTVKDEVIHN